MNVRKCAIVFFILATSANLIATRVLAFSFVPLGDLNGGIFSSTATDISGDGTIVVGYSTSANGSEEAFRWTNQAGMEGLGDIAGGVFQSRANAISLDGSTIVGLGTGAGGFEAFRWTESGSLVSLFDPITFPSFGEAFDVSSDGSVIVGRSRGAGQVAIRWTSASGPTDLPQPELYQDESSAYGVSGDGSVMVGNVTVFPTTFAYAWKGGGTDDFLIDPAIQEELTVARAVSESGAVIVGNMEYFASSLREAFLWTEGAGLFSLGVPNGFDGSTALNLSADASTIVGSLDIESSFTSQAAVWTEANGWRLVYDILSTEGIDLTGWTLTQAVAASADGRIITGVGINPAGFTESWLAVITIPEPSALGLIILPSIGLFLQRKRLGL